MITLGRILTVAVAAGVVVAGVVLWRIRSIRRVRWVVSGLAAYGVLALIHATLSDVTLRAALRGQGLFQAFPFMLRGAVIGCFVVLPIAWIVSMVRAGVPHFQERSGRSNLYQAIALTTCIAVVLTSFYYEDFGRPRSPHMDRQARAAALDRSLQAIEDGERESPRDRWDPEYVVNMVGRDPQHLFAWVRDNTSWIPYRGMLRGPVGVLMDRQGNSLDRALLLAALLERAGHSVRLAHGELKGEQAVEILASFVAHQAPFFKPTENDAALGALPQVNIAEVTNKYQLDPNSVQRTLQEQRKEIARAQADLTTRVTEQTSRLLTTVTKPDRAQELNKRRQSATAALCDHWWVQRQDGQKWVDMDVLAPAEKTDASLVASDSTMAISDVPAELHHEITVRVITEQWSGGTRKVDAVLQHVLRPTELFGRPVVLQFWPGAWASDLQADPNGKYGLEANALEQTQWAVFLKVGHDSVAQAVIGASGATNDPASSNPFGALGGAIARDLGQQNAGELTAAWIEYEIHVPGEAGRTIRRVVFDLLGPALRKSGSAPRLPFSRDQRLTRSLALMMQTEILPVGCRIAAEFVAHLATQSFFKNRELLGGIVGDHFSLGSEAAQKQLANAEPFVSPLLLLAVLRLEWSGIADHVFVDRPNILTRHRTLAVSGNDLASQDAVDIVANEVGVDLAEEDAFSIRLEQGVLDTNAEALLRGGPVMGNTAEAYAVSQDWQSINPGQNFVLSSAFSDDLRRRVVEDLDSGYMVVAPQAPVQKHSEIFAGWWRIDPRSGDTLGMSANGWGGAGVEGANLITMAAQAVQGFAFEYALCQGISQAINGVRMLNEKYFGAWHPSWTTGIKSRDPAEIFRENQKVCLVQAIIGGFVATLPLLMITMKVRQARIATETAKRIAAKEAEAKILEEYLEKTIVTGAEGDFEITAVSKGTPGLRNNPALLLERERTLQTLKGRMSKITQEMDKTTSEAVAYVQGRPGGLLPSPTYDPMVEEALFNRLNQEEREFNQIYTDLRKIDPGTYTGRIGAGGGKPRAAPPPKFGGNDNVTLSGPKQLIGSAGASNALGGGTP